MLEHLIFENLITNEEYTRKVIPFLKEEYFSSFSDKIIYNLINDYFIKYNMMPSKEALAIELSNKENISEQAFKECKEIIGNISDNKQEITWLVNQTEKFCQEKALYNAIMKSIGIINEIDNKSSKGAIPQILTDALAVSFDANIGHDFIEDFDSRYDFYHQKEIKVPFNIQLLNTVTNGGLPKKTLNVVLAGTGVGKSLFMCHAASGNLAAGLNVLYITLEMAEERIAERIDANLLDLTIDDLKVLPKEMYERKISRLKRKTEGKLIIKEYPTACAGSANFRHLLNELKIKKNFTPDIIYIDYLNICMSSRIKYGANINSYTLVKAIAEELRGLAVEYNVPIVTATQTNRSGYTSSDVGLEDTSESFGLPATADLMFALISTEELEQLNQIMVKQLKNRYSDPGTNRRFVVGIDRSKMRLFDVEPIAQSLIDGPNSKVNSDKSVFDNSKFGSEDFERLRPKSKFDRSKFQGFK